MTHEEAIREIAAWHEKQLMQFIANLEKEHEKLWGQCQKPKRVLIARMYLKTGLSEEQRN